MRNRRSTRRARARRWQFLPQNTVTFWICRLGERCHVSVQYFPGRRRPWLPLMVRGVFCVCGDMQPSRAAAMRAAEHLARRSWTGSEGEEVA